MKTFFRNKRQAFWTLQIGGWLGYGLMRMSQGLAFGNNLDYASFAVAATLIGFVLSLIMRCFYRRLRTAPLSRILPTVLVTCSVMALIMSPIEVFSYVKLYDRAYETDALGYFGTTMLEVFVLLAWSAIYFGVNYYELLQGAKEQALKATAMAHQAQLKMLRYQLNPHFLFNTLNAISTLVLEKDTDNANGMLGRLSSFLRYSLVNQPTQKVSLEQELFALRLYLEIEEVRFQDRLKIDWNIEDEARAVLIPSLLMQPLIENAIKYAIAPSEDGGTIAISAIVDGGWLELRIRDNGPGISDENDHAPELSSGVGIANTRARLAHIYGEDHDFDLANVEPSGLEVVIRIPTEFGDGEEADAE